MTTVRESVLLMGGGFAIFAVAAGATSAVLGSNLTLPLINAIARPSPSPVCKTIATDPNPPLNVRSSPVVAPDNIIGKLKNGTQLTVIDENEGWLRITDPLEGWVYKQLTVTSCVPKTAVASPVAVTVVNPNSPETAVMTEATEYYHAGNLPAAIARLQTIPSDSPLYEAAQKTVVRWQQDWGTAEAEFYSAQKALKDGRWQDVLSKVERFPANRFWRGKLVPIVKAAIEQQQKSARPSS